jgi:hypothetical protein
VRQRPAAPPHLRRSLGDASALTARQRWRARCARCVPPRALLQPGVNAPGTPNRTPVLPVVCDSVTARQHSSASAPRCTRRQARSQHAPANSSRSFTAPPGEPSKSVTSGSVSPTCASRHARQAMLSARRAVSRQPRACLHLCSHGDGAAEAGAGSCRVGTERHLLSQIFAVPARDPARRCPRTARDAALRGGEGAAAGAAGQGADLPRVVRRAPRRLLRPG